MLVSYSHNLFWYMYKTCVEGYEFLFQALGFGLRIVGAEVWDPDSNYAAQHRFRFNQLLKLMDGGHVLHWPYMRWRMLGQLQDPFSRPWKKLVSWAERGKGGWYKTRLGDAAMSKKRSLRVPWGATSEWSSIFTMILDIYTYLRSIIGWSDCIL